MLRAMTRIRPPLVTWLAAAVLGTLCGLPADAQGWPAWVEAEGRLALGASDRVPGADLFLFGDATLRFAPEAVSPLGFELGVYGRADALDTPHETYGAFTFDIGPNGRLAAGVPRPAYDLFAVSALEGPFPSLGVDRAAATRSAATAGAMFANWLPYGVAFENEAGGLRYAISVHDAANVDTTVAGFGLETELGGLTLSGAVEIAWGTGTDVSGKVQATGRIGEVTAGVGYYAPGAAGASDLVEGFASYAATDRLTLSAVVQVPTDGASDPTAGVAAAYGVNDALAVSVGVASDAGADASFNAFVDFRF